MFSFFKTATLCDLKADGCGCTDGYFLSYEGTTATCVQADECKCRDHVHGKVYENGEEYLDEATCYRW